MRSSRDNRRRPRPADRAQAENAKCDRRHCQKTLSIVGIGPGSRDHLSRRAIEVLKTADTVVGYTTYIDLIRPLVGDKTLISTPMTKEVDRVETAIRLALEGNRCAVVSSGDPGIYAMAGLVLEMCQKKEIVIVAPHAETPAPANSAYLCLEVVPGIPALCSGAALLGAPLAHDFSVISLSDLLTPWDIIARRLEAAAEADFVIILYNPRSQRRKDHLKKAQDIIMKYRDGKTPVGIVTRAMRTGQRVRLVPLHQLHASEVDMQTTVFVGSSASFRYLDFMVTPRGYSRKYDIDSPCKNRN